MQVYLNIFGFTVPSYGFIIATGLVLANIIAVFVLKYTKQDFNDFIILEAYCILGAFIGAKVLYLIVSYKEIDWSKITNIYYLNNLMLTGFVFYGGLIIGLIFVLVSGKIHKIQSLDYIRNFIFLIPFIHCFGRIGCFMAGCCYGIPYKGFGAVVFPKDSYAISDESLFPVQLVEAICLMIIAVVILYLQIKYDWFYTVETYLIIYAILRFGLEYLRYDEARGHYGMLSTSQWTSIVLLIAAVISVIFNNKKKKKVKLYSTDLS
jgi:phosphatidylglycerol:prolipoprotein diacylglycerol transferase